jgi:hypothetical protein
VEQIVIQVQDKQKARLLSELLQSLDFVEMVTTDHQENSAAEIETDFFALAGIWEDRQIDLNTLRQNAWPRQTS